MLTIREALSEGGASLTAAGIASPGLDASLLLAQALGVSRSSLLAAGAQPLAQEALAVYRGFIQRRLAGECVAYIIGKKEFYGLEFLVNPSVLVPRPETETLVEAALEIIGASHIEPSVRDAKTQSTRPLESGRVLDLCTGSGAVAIALKHAVPQLEVWATDISAEALETAQANAKRLLPPNSINFRLSDLFIGIRGGCSKTEHLASNPSPLTPHPSPTSSLLPFTLIVSNPPYVSSADIAGLPAEVRAEPLLALDGGCEGLDIIKKIIAEAQAFLCPGGIALMEADPAQMDKIAVMFAERGFCKIHTCPDLTGRQRVICAQLPI